MPTRDTDPVMYAYGLLDGLAMALRLLVDGDRPEVRASLRDCRAAVAGERAPEATAAGDGRPVPNGVGIPERQP